MSAALTSHTDVIADLSELHFADSSVMVELALLASRLRTGGLTLRLRGPQPHVQALIELVGLTRLPAISVCES
jgi:anti-anti-sigma regulatory factor